LTTPHAFYFVDRDSIPIPSDAQLDAFTVACGNGRPIHVLGNDAIIKISSRDTGGAFTVFEGQTQPLAGPPLHRHCNQDEWWYILEGEYKFEVDGREIYAGAGATVFAPRGSRHTFQNIGTTPGRTLTTVIPGGIDLFFEELEAVAPRGAIPDPAKIMPIFKKYDQELLGPPIRADVASYRPLSLTLPR
jgi:mannose-6-phosphate isomerase-like protein (cupin superfamily)